MTHFTAYIIKSFKHDGHLHRTWMENWRVPVHLLRGEHLQEETAVFINSQTKIVEADGKEWVSRIPGVSFFIPKQWFNVVALIEETGVRYYCNIASPLYLNGNVLTYIDYDLDVIQLPSGEVQVVDQEEYERHKSLYHYSPMVNEKVQQGLEEVLDRVDKQRPPFDDEAVRQYYRLWDEWRTGLNTSR